MLPASAPNQRPAAVAIRSGLAVAMLFELITGPETQFRAAWSASPWRQDPYHTAVLLAQVTTPMLVVAVLLRLAVRSPAGQAEREQQLVRATGITIALIALALCSEWASVVADPARQRWRAGTGLEVVGLGLCTAFSLLVTQLLWRARSEHGATQRWRHDWLADGAILIERLTGLGRRRGPQVVEQLRRHTSAVFLAASMLAAAAGTAAQAFGEGITDLRLIAWNFLAITAALSAFCFTSNAIVGFIARPPRSRTRQTVERGVVAGGIAVLVAIAFHDPLWSLVGRGQLTAGGLIALTSGAGGLAATLAAVASHLAGLRRPEPSDTGRVGTLRGVN